MKAPPRTYHRNAKKDYLSLAKRRKRTARLIQKAIKRQLQYIWHDPGYIDGYLKIGMTLSEKDTARLAVIRTVYEQQKYMYENNVHSVPDRIVSISQLYIRPIVRGKAKASTEFGAKLDLSVDDDGMDPIEKQSSDAYNESDVLPQAVENYKKHTDHYLERILADNIYRNRKNLCFCRDHGIPLSRPAIGRPKKDTQSEKSRNTRML